MRRLNYIGAEEKHAVSRVMDSGLLSGFAASASASFYGGPEVLAFEKEFADYIGCKHAVSVNSWSSGILIGLGAMNLEPGDEVIVSSWNMCSTVTSILQWLCIPVFCDIDASTFSLDINKLEECITDKTKVIIVNDMHGLSADTDAVIQLAKKYNIQVFSDSAQSIGNVSTVADIGGYSFNWHKHIHCGEGGVCVTNDDTLAQKMRLLRNHAEGVVGDFAIPLANMIGFNFRLTEIQAAILREQLKKLPIIIQKRKEIAKKLSTVLSQCDFITLPDLNNNVFCDFVLEFSDQIKRDKCYTLLSEYGIDVSTEFSRGPVHLLPVFQQQQAYGTTNLPWSLNDRQYDYSLGTLPETERLTTTFLNISVEDDYNDTDIEYIAGVCNLLNTSGSADMTRIDESYEAYSSQS